jgi:hypothetical protein
VLYFVNFFKLSEALARDLNSIEVRSKIIFLYGKFMDNLINLIKQNTLFQIFNLRKPNKTTAFLKNHPEEKQCLS